MNGRVAFFATLFFTYAVATSGIAWLAYEKWGAASATAVLIGTVTGLLAIIAWVSWPRRHR